VARRFILAYLAVQLLLPASYYLAGREFDERFAWRMFSPTRVTPCQAEFTTTAGAPVGSLSELHRAWFELVSRARPAVLEGYARWECARMRERGEPAVLHVDLRCTRADGEPYRPIAPDQNLCEL
jgi:hypothetical protein